MRRDRTLVVVRSGCCGELRFWEGPKLWKIKRGSGW